RRSGVDNLWLDHDIRHVKTHQSQPGQDVVLETNRQCVLHLVCSFHSPLRICFTATRSIVSPAPTAMRPARCAALSMPASSVLRLPAPTCIHRSSSAARMTTRWPSASAMRRFKSLFIAPALLYLLQIVDAVQKVHAGLPVAA